MEIELFWRDVYNEDEVENLFSCAELWLTLHKILTHERFISLRKVFLDLAPGRRPNSKYKELALSYINDLFPKARKGQHFEIISV